MQEEKKQEKDHSGVIGLGAAGAGAAAGGATVAALAGGTSAAAITYALGAIGGIVGGGMVAGLGVLLAGPIAIGAGAYGISKAVKKSKQKKQNK